MQKTCDPPAIHLKTEQDLREALADPSWMHACHPTKWAVRSDYLVDLDSSIFFADHVLAEFELAEVVSVEDENGYYTVVEFEGVGAAGYDPGHLFQVERFPSGDFRDHPPEILGTSR